MSHDLGPGYIAEGRNPHVPSEKVVIYDAAEAEIDVDEKYAIVCDSHQSVTSEAFLSDARADMEAPEGFCSGCRGLVLHGYSAKERG